MEEAAVMMVGIQKNKVLLGMNELLNNHVNIGTPTDYQIKNVSDKIVRIIISYINYINEKVYFNEKL